MALVTCKECKNQVSSTAKICPSCGVKMPKKTSKVLIFLLGFVVVGIIAAGISKPTPSQATSLTPADAKTGTQSAPPAKTALTGEAREKVIKESVVGLKAKYDKVEKQSFYSSKLYSKEVTGLTLYVGLAETDGPWLRSYIAYTGSDWVFMTKMKIVADGATLLEQTMNYTAVKRETGDNGKVYEWIDQEVNDSTVATLRTLANSKSATMRLEGDKSARDHDFTAAEKKALLQVIEAYEKLKKVG